MAALSNLPLDIALLYLAQLEVGDLARLAACSKVLGDLVNTHAWPALVRNKGTQSHTLGQATRHWLPRDHVRFALATERAWQDVNAALIQIGPTRSQRALPVLSLDKHNGRLWIGIGPHLYSVRFDHCGRPVAATPRPTQLGVSVSDDLTGLIAIPGTEDAVVGTLRGAIHRVKFMSNKGLRKIATYKTSPFARSVGAVQALSCSAAMLASISTPRAGSKASKPLDEDSRHRLSLYPLQAPTAQPIVIELPDKPWSVHLESRANYVAIGSTAKHPLSVFSLTPAGPAGLPRQLLGPSNRSAVYACGPMPGFQSSPQVILSGWYDGVIRLHDLRSPEADAQADIVDRWSEDAIYCLSTHLHAHRLVAGTSRHSAIRIADLRMQQVHTTLYASVDESPIYSIALEGSRILSVTDRRTVMIDFAPGVVEGWWRCSPPWAHGARPRYARTEEALRLRVFRDETQTSFPFNRRMQR